MTAASGGTGGGSTGIDFPVVPSFLGTAVSGGCGCVAFLAGAALAIALFAPQFLAGYGARVLERDLGRLVDGRVEVGDVRLAWRGRQTAGRVRVSTPDGDLLLEGSLTFPSLFALLGEGGARGEYGLRIDRLRARVDEAGECDLARAFGLDVAAGETVVSALRDRVMAFVRGGGERAEARGEIRFDVRLARGAFVGPDGREVELEGVGFTARSHRLGALVDLSSGTLRADGAGDASAEFHAAFDERGRLTYASAAIDPISADSLRMIGWLPRREPAAPRGARLRGLHARAAEGALAILTRIARPGARIDFRLGREPGQAGPPSGDAADLPLTLVITGAAGAIDLDGIVRGVGEDAVLLARPAADRPALRVRGSASGEAFAALLRPLAPAGVGVTATAAGADAPAFRALSRGRELRVPLSALGDGLTARSLEQILRGTRLRLDVDSTGAGARFARPGASAPDDVLRVEHVVTNIALRPDSGARAVSFWRSPDAPARYSAATLDVPGGSGEATLDLEVVGMPRSLLIAASDLPAEVAALFYDRLHRVVVRDLPIATIARSGSLLPAGGLRIEVFPTEDERQSLSGTLRNNTFSCDAARFDLSLGDGAVRGVFFDAMMPWLSGTRTPGPTPGRVIVELEDLEIDLTRSGGDREARVTLRSDPLEARLHPGLAEEIRRGADAGEQTEYGDGWIAWAPPPMTYVVDGDSIDHLDVDLPLLDEESARMSGSADASGGYTLRGEIETRLLPAQLVRSLLGLPSDMDIEAAGVELIPVTIDAPSRGSVELLFSRRVLDVLLGPLGVDDAVGR